MNDLLDLVRIELGNGWKSQLDLKKSLYFRNSQQLLSFPWTRWKGTCLASQVRQKKPNLRRGVFIVKTVAKSL